jgi:hypothetical protein
MAVRTGTDAAAYAGGWIGYSGSVSGAIFRSTDFGATWESLPTAPADTVTGILADYEEGPRVFCATTGGLYLTTDEGQSWSRVINQRGMRAVAGSRWRYAAAGDAGLWVSTDSGLTWAKMDSGLPVTKVNCLGFVTGTDDWLWLLAGTNGGATYYWDFGPTAVAEPRSTPAGSRAAAFVCGNRLQIRMEEAGFVSLVDASGRTVMKVSLPRGAAELDISRLPAGVYQVVPSAGSAASHRIVRSR